MPQSYTLEFKKKIVRLHEEEGHTYKNITVAYSKPASLNGVENSVKDAKPQHTMTRTTGSVPDS